MPPTRLTLRADTPLMLAHAADAMHHGAVVGTWGSGWELTREYDRAEDAARAATYFATKQGEEAR